MPGLGEDDDPTNVHLIDMVDYLVDYVVHRDLTDVVLVGHSWGGILLSGASPRLADRIEQLVYWNAFVPLTGESVIDLCPPDLRDAFRASAKASTDNSSMHPFDVFCSYLMQDAAPETQKLVYSLLKGHPFHSMTESLDLHEWERLQLPSTYVISADDLALPPGEWGWVPRFPDRLPSGSRVLQTVGSHEALFTQPGAIAAAFIEAATVTPPARRHRGAAEVRTAR